MMITVRNFEYFFYGVFVCVPALSLSLYIYIYIYRIFSISFVCVCVCVEIVSQKGLFSEVVNKGWLENAII